MDAATHTSMLGLLFFYEDHKFFYFLVLVAEVHSLHNLLSYMNCKILKCILTAYCHKYALNLHKTL